MYGTLVAEPDRRVTNRLHAGDGHLTSVCGRSGATRLSRMTSKVAAALAVIALVLTGCSSSSDTPEATPSASASIEVPAETTLTQWANQAGLITAITTITEGLTSDLTNLTSPDVAAVGEAFTKRATEIADLAADIAAGGKTDDATYEQLRASVVSALEGFSAKAAALGTASASERAAAVLAATTSLTVVTTAIQGLVDYIATHGTEAVHPAA